MNVERGPIQIVRTEPLPKVDREIFTTVGMRVRAAHEIIKAAPGIQEINTLQPNEWLSMNDKQYESLEHSALLINQGTTQVRSDKNHYNEVGAMNVDFGGLVKHIRVMQYAVEDLWDQGFKNAFPEGTTLAYAKWLCLSHDYYRFANINGPLPLDYVDRVSDTRIERDFPTSPASEHLHTMSMITGVADLPSDEHPIPYVFKLLDTTAKPEPRFPDVFFNENGPYDEWIDRQVKKGSLPFYAVKLNVPREERFRQVTADEYKNTDIALTQKGLSQLQEIIPNVDYNGVLAKAAARVANDPHVVEDFGKIKNSA